jgi:redox-sensitive bicupin YhaK (pirin superfamily)
MPDAVELVIEPRERDLGGLVVRRALPSSKRRMVGPFIFFDHMGPAEFPPGGGLDARPHPHIHLATVTYLFEGEILHRDSLGFALPIRPGAVNWMTAGRGIVHSERTPHERRAAAHRLHGIQTWVALPRADEDAPPAFHHHPEASLPAWREDGAALRLVAGAAFGRRAPVAVFSDLFYVDATLAPGARVVLPDRLGERGVYVAVGSVAIGRETHPAGRLLVLPESVATAIAAGPDGARAILFGGAALDGERHVWWNFVSSAPERIERAKADWRDGRFPSVPGETERIPLPES